MHEDATVYVFAHLPKTGGQSLRHHFQDHLVFHETFIHLGPVGRLDETARGLARFEDRSEAERRRARVILGHEVNHQTGTLVPGRKTRVGTFLRDPVDRLGSLYNFRMHLDYTLEGLPPPSFLQWYGELKPNPVCRWFLRHYAGIKDKVKPAELEARASQVLADLDFVGRTEQLDEDSRPILDEIGVPHLTRRRNVAGRDFPVIFEIDERLRERISDENSCDVALWNRWSSSLYLVPPR